jgi:hypothetical protein
MATKTKVGSKKDDEGMVNGQRSTLNAQRSTLNIERRMTHGGSQ